MLLMIHTPYRLCFNDGCHKKLLLVALYILPSVSSEKLVDNLTSFSGIKSSFTSFSSIMRLFGELVEWK